MAVKRRSKPEVNYQAMIRRRVPFKSAKKLEFGIQTSHGKTWIRGSRLGQGNFGAVFSATSATASPVILLDDDNDSTSILPSDLAVKSADLSQSSSLRSETLILCKLSSSPYIVRCYGDEITKSDDGKLYYNILMENCIGGSLASRIKDSKGVGLPEREARCYMKDIVRGLCYIHNHGYIQCDIKPANILLTLNSLGGFTAKIADFGLAKKSNFGAEEYEECSGLRGTYRYMSPESVEYKTQGWFSDVCALGCILVEMMTGKLVWAGSEIDKDVEDLLRRIAYSPELPEFPSNLSKKGRKFLESCFERDVNFRWSAQMLMQHPFLSEYD